MKIDLPRVSMPFLNVRTLVALWAGSVFLVWAVLALGWLAAERTLTRLGDQVIDDVRALNAAKELERGILAHRREDLLWEATGEDYHRLRRDEHLREVEQIAASLDPYVTTLTEQTLLAQIRANMPMLWENVLSGTPISLEVEAQMIDELLELVRGFQEQNESQMEASVQAANRLHRVVSWWVLGLSLGTAGLLLAGSLSVIGRVVRPVLTLTHAANAFGRGELATRASVLCNDELGGLARTFNNMADDIANRESERMRFVAMVAHDLKNPVLAIEMATRMLHTPIEDERERVEYLDGIAGEAKRLRKIVRDLTDDIQVASGRFSVEKKPVNLGELVRRFIENRGNASMDHEIIVEAAECVICADAERIERVVMNLVSNAIKYSPRGTRITVRVHGSERFAVLSVADQGPGIAKEDLKALFQPFGRGRSADTFAEGAGMGLYVVKQIVEAHDGQIEVHSQPGKGATFLVKLPLPRTQPQNPPNLCPKPSGSPFVVTP